MASQKEHDLEKALTTRPFVRKIDKRIAKKEDEMKHSLAFVIIFTIALAACSPSQEEIQATVQASIVETQRAMPTNTQLPTETPIPTATETVTITPSPSPTPDVRVIDVDPRELLLQKDDLPPEGRYYLPGPGWISPARNSEIVSSWTVAEGQAYLAETGRIDGWIVYYNRGTSSVLMPQVVYDNVVLYSNIEGARLVVTKYGNRRITEENYTEIDVPQVGDVTRAFTKRETNSGGEVSVLLYVSFSYRNVSHSINISGWEKEVTLDFGLNIANRLLEVLEQLPLSNSVSFKP